MGILKNKTLRRHCFSYSDILANKQHGTENGINISTKSKNVLLFCDILDSSNTVGFRLDCVGSGEYYVGFNHPNCQNNLVYSPNMRELGFYHPMKFICFQVWVYWGQNSMEGFST